MNINTTVKTGNPKPRISPYGLTTPKDPHYGTKEVVRDTFTQLTVPMASAFTSTAVAQAVDGGALGAVGLAAGGLVIGGFLGGWGSRMVQELSGGAIGLGGTPWEHTNSVAATGAIVGGLAGAAGSIAGSFGAAPTEVALITGGATLALLGGRELLSRLDF